MTSINTLAQLVEEGCQRLNDSSDSAKLDAQLLLCFVLNREVTYLLTWPEKTATEKQIQQYKALLIKRQQGEPIAYLIGFKEFWSLKLAVSPATLIPRPDTEILVEQVLAMSQDDNHGNYSCLDLGTGTGAIALAIASEKPHWQIEAIDFNEQAVQLAQTNTNQHQLSNVKVYQSNWFEQIDKNKKFSVIVSNPPYIDPQDIHLSLGDVRFEPKTALIADNAGLDDIVHIASQARDFLEENGLLFLEHGYDQGKAVRELLASLGYQNIDTVKDLSDNERISFARYNVIN